MQPHISNAQKASTKANCSCYTVHIAHRKDNKDQHTQRNNGKGSVDNCQQLKLESRVECEHGLRSTIPSVFSITFEVFTFLKFLQCIIESFYSTF